MQKFKLNRFKTLFFMLSVFIALSENSTAFDFFQREGEPYQIEEQIEQFYKPGDHSWQFGYNIFFSKYNHETHRDRYVNIRRVKD